MIGIDTNILVRAFLEDDKIQSQEAQQILKTASDKNNLFIASYAILEFVWVLKVYKFSRQEIYDAVIILVDSPGITIGNREVVIAALEHYIKGKADFGDYMILSEGLEYGSKRLKTFDKVILKELSPK